MRLLALLLLCCGTLAACATSLPEMTRQEMLAATVRVYAGKTKEEVRNAAETLFLLAFGDAGRIAVREDEVTAAHNVFIFIIINAISVDWQWQVRVQDDPRGGKAIVRLTSSGEIVIGNVSGPVDVRHAIHYELFWARMDYLLDRSNHWPTCAEQKQTLGSLCLQALDQTPNGSLPSAR